MGSKGTGTFSDYPGSDKPKASEKAGGQGGGGGDMPKDRCGKAFNAVLEDVEHCDFFRSNGTGPKIGTVLRIAHKKRIVATAAGVVVGNLPTSMNYLAGCLKDGYTYAGRVLSAKTTAGVTIISVDFAASAPK